MAKDDRQQEVNDWLAGDIGTISVTVVAALLVLGLAVFGIISLFQG